MKGLTLNSMDGRKEEAYQLVREGLMKVGLFFLFLHSLAGDFFHKLNSIPRLVQNACKCLHWRPQSISPEPSLFGSWKLFFDALHSIQMLLPNFLHGNVAHFNSILGGAGFDEGWRGLDQKGDQERPPQTTSP